MTTILGFLAFAAAVVAGLVARIALVVLLLGVVWVATLAVWAPVQGASRLWNRTHAH